MHMSKILPATLLAAACLPSAIAAKCAAVGTTRVGAGGGRKGGFAEVDDTIAIHDENKNKLYSGGDKVCSDLTTIKAADMGLESDFVWAASCNISNISECHGSYGAQTHIDGNEPGTDTDFYGIASTSSSSCMIEFDC